jgi:hypothetical protein
MACRTYGRGIITAASVTTQQLISTAHMKDVKCMCQHYHICWAVLLAHCCVASVPSAVLHEIKWFFYQWVMGVGRLCERCLLAHRAAPCYVGNTSAP